MSRRDRHAVGKEEEVALGRVVTPMLDMTFQLLFYFIMNFRPPISEGQLDFSLPKESPDHQTLHVSLPDEKPDEYRLTIYSADGSIAAVSWRNLATGGSAEEVPLGNNVFWEVENKLKTVSKPPEGKGKPPVIKLECAEKLMTSEVVRVMDVCKKLGFHDVGLLPIPKKAPPKP